MRGKEIKRRLTKSDYGVIFLAIVSVLFIILGIYFLFFSEEARDTKEGYERQNAEETIADEYIQHLLELAEREASSSGETFGDSSHEGNGSETGEVSSGNNPDEPADVTISMDDIYTIVEEDPNYYERDGVTYTPDYAKGYLAFVLDVPTAGIKRGVYGGTWEELKYDLDIWMVTLARPDYELGKTHLCIYGHNHTAQELSFNNLYKVQVGDEFYLYCETGYYRYEVTNVFAEWRNTVTTNYVDNFSLGSDKCFIITCGRNEHRYKDIVVEGTLAEHLTLPEYAKMLQEKQSE